MTAAYCTRCADAIPLGEQISITVRCGDAAYRVSICRACLKPGDTAITAG